ncbi:MAG: hypothetical protein NTU81_01980 [Candidatus Nomurabacteria bacterium]|nr:hypothetical protein [Candidatus Nomurabacteria bacterium]
MDRKNIFTFKTISIFFIISIVISFSQFSFPYVASATGDGGLNWDNPNSGDNPYQVNSENILNTDTLMGVVGCTGIVDKVSTQMTDFIKNQANKLLDDFMGSETVAGAQSTVCQAGKDVLTNVAGWIPYVSDAAAPLVDSIDCTRVGKTINKSLETKIDNSISIDEANKKREDCFNGLATRLAQNQLASMTHQTVNWVNHGLNGNPMYVQSVTKFTNGIEKNVYDQGVQRFSNGAFPYGKDFSRSIVTGYNAGALKYGAANFLDSLTSDLAAFITDKNSYVDTGTPETALQRSQRANNNFANDFSSGGWDGYMALTQKESNNPLGFNMLASQKLADRIAQQTSETKDEVAQNNGFLSQKTCAEWQIYDGPGKPKIKSDIGPAEAPSFANNYASSLNEQYVFSPNKSSANPNYDVCTKWNVVTPGSIIKDKLSSYINSPDRQLEVAKTINDSLSSLFSNLLDKFKSNGLASLSDNTYTYNNENIGVGGYGSNTSNDYLGDNTGANNSGYSGYTNSQFDLTRDLGNTYIHTPTISLGNWNAYTNEPNLYINLAPYDEANQRYYPSNYYYNVTTDGNTKLFNNGYTGWEKGDRAFWNGKEWQNWKCGGTIKGVCKNQTSPIDKRGVIQIQKDYIVATKEILQILPSVMPKLGELEYCIPGPNPSFKANTGQTASYFIKYAQSIEGHLFDNSGGLTFSYWTADKEGKESWENYFNSIFPINPDKSPTENIAIRAENKNSALWKSILTSLPMTEVANHYAIAYGDNDGSREINAMNVVTNSVKTRVPKLITMAYEKYAKAFKDTYETMQHEFNESEKISTLIKNTAYVPMVEEGYNMTKNIVRKNEDVNTKKTNYANDASTASLNTSKLNGIKKEVSIIIKAAQDRRDAQLLSQLNNLNQLAINACVATRKECENDTNNAQCLIDYKNCIKNATSAGNILTFAQYKTKYEECFAEEDILYYDPSDIIGSHEDGLRCTDGLDNDMDGLVDSQDPDCK